VYSAALDVNTAIGISPLEQFLCNVSEAGGAAGETRRQASAEPSA
jgi:hypothetical protein